MPTRTALSHGKFPAFAQGDLSQITRQKLSATICRLELQAVLLQRAPAQHDGRRRRANLENLRVSAAAHTSVTLPTELSDNHQHGPRDTATAVRPLETQRNRDHIPALDQRHTSLCQHSLCGSFSRAGCTSTRRHSWQLLLRAFQGRFRCLRTEPVQKTACHVTAGIPL